MFGMTSNNLLKKLQDVQCKIRQCKEVLKGYKAPTVKFRMGKDMAFTLGMLMNRDIDIDSFVHANNLDFDYLEELGTYFVNVAKYQKDTEKYQEEICQLKNMERKIKDDLGID